MFVRWQKRQNRRGRLRPDARWDAFLIETIRIDGKPRARCIACIASIKQSQIQAVTIALKDAIVLAAETVGDFEITKSGKYKADGEGGLVGYCTHIARHHPNLFTPMLNKVLPMHVTVAAVQNRKYRTEEEVRALCAERGVPFEDVLDIAEAVPTKLIDVTPDHDPEKR
jgi:hypothetical protein